MSDKRDDLPQSRSAAANPAVKRAPQGEASVPSSTRRRASVQPIPLPTAPRRGYGCADVITAIFLLLSILTISLTILLIANPRSPLNPFPPGTSVVIYITTTPLPTYTRTPTATPLPPTVTLIPTSTTTRTITPTLTLTNTPLFGGAQPTLTKVTFTATPLYTPSKFQFTVAKITYTMNTSPAHCLYQGIAGTVLDLQTKPLAGVAVYVTGGSNDRVQEYHFSGEPQAVRFGPSGFEAVLGAEPREESFTIQLRSQTGVPLSEAVIVKTRTGCNQNLAIVDFVQNH